jgi:metal-responsive CopG/Arc/MetJ family transcriptional regulator
MVKRTTISVPDELYAKMEKWRKSINFSEEFRRHIQKVIQQKEELHKKLKGDKDMMALIERLRRQKIDSEVNHYENGKADGIEWAKTAHYDDLKIALKMELGDDGLPSDIDFREQFMLFFTEDQYGEGCLDSNNHRGVFTNEFGDKYIAGWRDGVQDFWNMVKDKL